MTCDHGIPLNRYCGDCEQGVTFVEETPAENARRWFASLMVVIAALLGLGAAALAVRLVFELLGVIHD